MESKKAEIAKFILANGLESCESPAQQVIESFIKAKGRTHHPGSGKAYTASDVSNAYRTLKRAKEIPVGGKSVTYETPTVAQVVDQVIRITKHLTDTERQKLVKHLAIEWEFSG